MQSITIHLATNKGLGRHRTSLDDPTWDAYSKAFYSSQILQIATICITKISCILVFMRMVSGKQMKRERRVLIFFLIFVALWGIAAIVALALQCQTPFPWNMSPERCYNEV